MAERALMFVHMGVDVENQWGRAVAALEHMSNLEVALVWRRLSVQAGDFKTHSEYKCLFKRAVREAEGQQQAAKNDYSLDGHVRLIRDTSDGFSDIFGGIASSEHYEFPRGSHPGSVRYNRGNSGFSVSSSFMEREKDKRYEKFLEAVVRYGIKVGHNGENVLKPLPDEPISPDQIEEYCEALISVISDQGNMNQNTKDKLIEIISHSRE